jgi:hypothetical protein
VQLTAPGDQEGIGAVRVSYTQSYVAAQLLVQALADLARGAPASLPACKGRGVHPKGHAHGRLFHLDDRQGLRVLGSASVSPMAISSKPAMTTISPAWAESTATRSNPLCTYR